MSGKRVRALDGVRGLAVLMVTVSHAGFPLFKLGASVGVTVFFVLSGYLITGLLLDEQERCGRVDFARFYRNRALRLLPALGVLLVVWAPVAFAVGIDPGRIVRGAVASLLYFQNVIQGTGWWPGAVLPHLWSLSLEEQFYLLWPVLVVGAVRFGRRTVVAVAAVGVVGSVAGRFLLTDWHTAGGYREAYYLPQYGVWAVLAGAGLAAAVREWRVAVPAGSANAALVGLLLTGSVLGMTGGVLHSGLNYGPRLLSGPVAAVFAAVLIVAVTTAEPPRWVVHPWMLFLGVISYALYLWHDALIAVVQEKTGDGDLTHLAVGSVCAVAAVGIAAASRRWVEQPFLRMKSGPRRSAAR